MTRKVLFGLVVVALAIQLRQLAPAERQFSQGVVREPGRVLAPYPELRGGPAWIGRQSELRGGVGWETLLDQANRTIPESDSVLFLWSDSLKTDPVAIYAHSQAVYALYPRPIILMSTSEIASSPGWRDARYAIFYGATAQQSDLSRYYTETLYCGDDACLNRAQHDALPIGAASADVAGHPRSIGGYPVRQPAPWMP